MQYSSFKKQYNVKKIIIDILLFKLSIKNLKIAYNIYKIKTEIEQSKRSVISKLKKIDAKKIKIAVAFHNKYTLGEKITLQTYVQLFNKSLIKLNSMQNTLPATVLPELIKLLNTRLK